MPALAGCRFPAARTPVTSRGTVNRRSLTGLRAAALPCKAGYLFAVGLFGASALAAAVVPLATTYSITEAIGFERGVSRSFREAPVFLGLFTGLIVFGALVAMIPGIDVIQLLIVTQVVNGLLLPVELVTMIRLVNDREVMDQHANGRGRNVLAYGTVGAISALSVAYLLITILGLVGINVG